MKWNEIKQDISYFKISFILHFWSIKNKSNLLIKIFYVKKWKFIYLSCSSLHRKAEAYKDSKDKESSNISLTNVTKSSEGKNANHYEENTFILNDLYNSIHHEYSDQS